MMGRAVEGEFLITRSKSLRHCVRNNGMETGHHTTRTVAAMPHCDRTFACPVNDSQLNHARIVGDEVSIGGRTPAASLHPYIPYASTPHGNIVNYTSSTVAALYRIAQEHSTSGRSSDESENISGVNTVTRGSGISVWNHGLTLGQPPACSRLGSANSVHAQIPTQGLTVCHQLLLAKRLKLGVLGNCLRARSAPRGHAQG
ncbi:hypothetical protein BDW74DRAFT_86982 [Aspergillus multicolor]|uniref:uncharacterized protein n=1 Tax=Aspergillus multicolor TaxID=41759 RepID=UPI003CCC9D24